MKIAIVNNDFRVYFPPRLLALQEFLEARGDELYIIELFEESIDYKFSDNDKSVFRNHEFLFPTWQGISMKTVGRKLTGRLDAIGPDAVLCGAIAFPAGAVAVRWASNHGKAVVSFDNAKKDTFERGWLNRFIKRRIFRHVDAFLCPSPAWDASMQWWGFAPEQIFYGLNTSDNAFWSVDPGVDVEYNDFFLSVGRLIPKKNHIDILHAYRIYSEKAGAAARPLVIIGDGAQRPALERYIADNGLSGAALLPFKRPEELRGYYHRAACLIIASDKEETWGIVVNEAMNGGCAVMASDQTGCASTMIEPGVNGYIFPMGDIGVLAAAMISYDSLSTLARQNMSAAARQTVGQWGLDRFCRGVDGAVRYAMAHRRRCRNPLDWLILRLWKGRIRINDNNGTGVYR